MKVCQPQQLTGATNLLEYFLKYQNYNSPVIFKKETKLINENVSLYYVSKNLFIFRKIF